MVLALRVPMIAEMFAKAALLGAASQIKRNDKVLLCQAFFDGLAHQRRSIEELPQVQ